MLSRDRDRALRDAESSRDRYAAGAPLGPLDGVPITIKEEVDLDGQGHRLGHAAPGRKDAVDGTSVRKLRQAGAIILGHTPMTEHGMSPLGHNARRVLPRNPLHTGHSAGGSSTGAAVAVSTGLTPVALGSDGGGSIRIPSAFCGLFGIKPTFGRISRAGDGFGGTVDHLGPLGASVRDLAIFLEAVSGEDPGDDLTSGNPGFDRGWLEGALARGVRGLRIGVLEEEIDAATPECASACREALEGLAREGAELVSLSFPFARWAMPIGFITIGTEALAQLEPTFGSQWNEFGPDLQLPLKVISTFSATAYLDAQQFRTELRRQTAEQLRKVDVLALPTTRHSAPKMSDVDVLEGMTDTPELENACRYAFLGNLTGLPAGTAPVGTDSRGLPFGLQIIGDAWDEAAVLQVLAHLERTGISEVRKATVHARVLLED